MVVDFSQLILTPNFSHSKVQAGLAAKFVEFRDLVAKESSLKIKDGFYEYR
jgi:hypothetical protein